MSKQAPLPLFDSIEYISQQSPPTHKDTLFFKVDFEKAKTFLESYNGSQATFNAYRREVERLLHWSWLTTEKPVKDLRREDIVAYLEFCQAPPLHWIGTKKA